MISVSVFYYLYIMKDLYTYISEAKGYLDYDNFVNDIIHEIYFNDEIKNYFFEGYNKAIEYTSGIYADPNYENKPESVRDFISVCTESIMYPFDKAELSAFQQEFIQGTKDKIYDRDFINSILSSLKKSSIDNFYINEKKQLKVQEELKTSILGHCIIYL